MKTAFTIVLLCVLGFGTNAQLIISYTVDCNQQRKDISPYIYGINNGIYKHATFRRWGGNRTSAYNWENNFSNAGADYINNNDDYLPYIQGLAMNDYKKPGQVIIAYHDSSLLQNAFSAITLPMVGYVSNDGDGVVQANELAPSPRWDAVINVKPTALLLVPDTTDHQIFVNEELNLFINTFGIANTQSGIKGYIMDNEPGLWCNQFPHMRSNCVTYAELLTKSVSLSHTVKNMDNTAMVFGPESYGFNEYMNLQNAADLANYSGDHWFIDTYLKTMKHASDSVGERLLDVMSIHWYPELDFSNNYSIFSNDTTQATAIARMQRPRTLWDSTYSENTWIAVYFRPELPIIPHIQNSISTYYPGTKMGITEYDYGAFQHISGGIAQADALGVFGKTGLDFASLWNAPTGFAISAFELYRNYDGSGGMFGGTHIYANAVDTNTSIYAAAEDNTNNVLHIIMLNKSYTQAINASVNIANGATYTQADGYYFDAADTMIQHVAIGVGAINNNVFSYTLPPLTAYHFVLKSANAGVKNVTGNNCELLIVPNPSAGVAEIDYNLQSANGSIVITDIAGKTIGSYTGLNNQGKLSVHMDNAGTYLVHLKDGANTQTEKLVIIK